MKKKSTTLMKIKIVARMIRIMEQCTEIQCS